MKLLFLPVIFLFSTLSIAQANEVTGKARVIDGDTIEIGATTIRLFGIDAAETGQRCVDSNRHFVRPGDDASNRVEVLTQEGVTCVGANYDDYGRLLATCTNPSGVNINKALVSEGLAWAFVKYSDTFVAEEKKASEEKLGVWKLACEQPWVFRGKRWIVAQQKSPNGCPIKGNISANGHIYHTPWSRHYAATKISLEKGERWFCSEEEAIKAGFRAPIR
jgi:endonuclease YncB( thermonuclease family)